MRKSDYKAEVSYFLQQCKRYRHELNRHLASRKKLTKSLSSQNEFRISENKTAESFERLKLSCKSVSLACVKSHIVAQCGLCGTFGMSAPLTRELRRLYNWPHGCPVVVRRSGVYGWESTRLSSAGNWQPFYEDHEKEDYERKLTLCTACWNYAKSVYRKKVEAQKTRTLITKLKQELSKCLKSQQQAT